ncbi:hypothetical protein [Deinococcus peraridilitoris]|uniref:Uncharacterized protein n=1 Tax=Deinococcus peraridilitoris (strain DSM 19664 / LMG 22246 / CIP 109416 / KR-200) TaxID=937777 RepID=L0A2M6_DEIPD|nr:hypothetical protein [Deinococcus peraridilitoris]AFZ68086.1 hypothetical protein Deipe_2621 [Deinococcus peraridilitoris DSM 19664]
MPVSDQQIKSKVGAFCMPTFHLLPQAGTPAQGTLIRDTQGDYRVVRVLRESRAGFGAIVLAEAA